jgi:hypothetical protein
MALTFRGQIYLIDRRQVFSEKLGKVVTLLVLNKMIPVEAWNREHPKKKKDPDKVKAVKVLVKESFKELDILLELLSIYRGGESNG